MIHLEITKSNKTDELGQYKIYANIIHLGILNKNDIILSDPSLKDHIMTLKIIKNDIYITAHSYLSNGKKISGTKIYTNNSMISFGNIEFKVVNYKQNLTNHDLNSVYQKNIITHPYIENIIRDLKDELIILERKTDV